MSAFILIKYFSKLRLPTLDVKKQNIKYNMEMYLKNIILHHNFVYKTIHYDHGNFKVHENF